MAEGLLNLLRGRLPAYTRKARHVDLLLRYGTPRKVANILRAERAKMRGDVELGSRPYIYTIDIGNICNLRCPLCPTGKHELNRPQGFMSFADFERAIAMIAPWAVEVVLHNWGEPFLHPSFLDIVRAAKSARIGTATSSNLNLVHKDASYLYEVVDSGLDHLVLSIDGTTQEVYEQYRRGGNLEHVLANVKELCAYKKQRGSRTPVIEWQFLVMKQNEHQIEDARRIAAELGVDAIRFTGAGLPFDELGDVALGEQWLSTLPEYRGYEPKTVAERGYLYDEKCFYLYRAMTVNPRGEVAPCCAVSHRQWDFGNLLEDGLDAVWNNEFYRSARALFASKAEPQPVHTVCHVCPLFKYEQDGRASTLPQADPKQVVSLRSADASVGGVEARPLAPGAAAVAIPVPPPRSRLAHFFIRTIDIVVSGTVLLLTAPLLAMIAVWIKLDSPGPVLFRHVRIGENRRRRDVPYRGPHRRGKDLFGKPFTLIKFRTMYADARARFPELYEYRYDPEDLHSMPIKVLVSTKNPASGPGVQPAAGLLDDPRLTRVGRWLRRTSLDELPNFLNVLRGDLHLVGPRPDIYENIRYYERAHLAKLDVRPGVTGLAQVHGRGNLSFHETNEWDLEYVKHRSVWLDLKILAKTLWVSVRGDGAF